MKDVRIVILVSITLIMLTVNVLLIGKTRNSNELVLRSLVIVDEQGRERITLTAWENKAAVDILDRDGQPLARLYGRIASEKRFWDSASLVLGYADGGSPGMELNTLAGPEIKLIDHSGDAVSINASRTKRFPIGTYDIQPIGSYDAQSK